MRDVPPSMKQAWDSRLFIGERRPIARVTVQHPTMKLRNYSMMSTFSYKYDPSHVGDAGYITGFDLTKGFKVNNCYADFQFTNTNLDKHGNPVHPVRELPNVKSVSWSRSIDSDIAECTIEVWNTRPLQVGETPRADELDHPGYFTYSRGASQFSSRWGHTTNEWFGQLMPDNILRTFEGYGCDTSTTPELDPFLVQTGVWLIDSVTMNAGATMTIKCRDIGRILLEQYWMQPVVLEDFNLQDYINWDGKVKIGKKTPNPNQLKIKATHSSNEPWIGQRAVHGHPLEDAFDGNPNTYWLSIGNITPARRFAYEWVQCSVNSQTVAQVKIRTKKKGYVAYVSLRVDGVWQGSKSINYHQDDIGMNGGDIAYVKSVPITTEGYVTINVPDTAKVDAVRITLGNLQNFKFGPYKYRGGIRDVQVFGKAGSKTTTTEKAFTKGPAGSNPGRYDDYTDIIKLICGWGGFFWPELGGQLDCHGILHHVEPETFDSGVLGAPVRGRIWGDFQLTGTSGPNAIDYSNFDKKSLMDCIVFIRDTVGFLFFIDETGGVQWRFPNIYDVGNWRTTMSVDAGRSGDIITLDEDTNLISLEATLDQGNVREMILVGTGATGTPDTPTAGKGAATDYAAIGAYAPGWNPNPTGLRRVSIWTDVNFASTEECQQMADLIALAQLFTYRTDRVRIPGYPAIQIDDQVRINERVSSEGYLHYVKGISSSLDMGSGEWSYDLDTHWLGYDPDSKWLFDRKQFAQVTQDYLDALANDPDLNPFLGPTRTGYIHHPLPGE